MSENDNLMESNNSTKNKSFGDQVREKANNLYNMVSENWVFAIIIFIIVIVVLYMLDKYTFNLFTTPSENFNQSYSARQIWYGDGDRI